jgi:putative flippase GtrA
LKKLKDGLSILLQKPSTYKAPLRYFLAVVCGYCIDFAIYAALVKFGASVYWSNAAGFCVGSVVNTILIRKFVFQESRFSLSTDLQLSFASNALMFVLGMMVLWGLVELVAMNPYGAKLLTNGTTFVANYVIRAVYFRKK